MGSHVTWKHLLGLGAILAALAVVQHSGTAGTVQPLHYDHKQTWAYEKVPELARELFASAADGRALAVIDYSLVYPRMPPSYRSPECRPGGNLDLHPGGGWPD